MYHRLKEIILVGRSNVGKSSLLKALTGKKLKIGKKPGVTKKIESVEYKNYIFTDMPGFGFMSGYKKQESVKDEIVHYIEKHAKEIKLAIIVVNSVSFCEIVDRWQKRQEYPIEIEFYNFLNELNIDVVIAINKIDKLKNKDSVIDEIIKRFDLLPPWRQWIDIIAPISAKKGEIQALKDILKSKLYG